MRKSSVTAMFRFGIAMGLSLVMVAASLNQIEADTVIDFNELSTWTATGAAGSYYNGNQTNTSNTIGWTSGVGPTVYFGNQYSSDWGGFWNGFAYSNINDSVTGGYTNQYAAVTGTGFGGSGNYAVAYHGSYTFLDLPVGWQPVSVQLTNTTFAADSMQNGDAFAKKFGGLSGDDPDYFFVTLTGYDKWGGAGIVTGAVDFYLADFRFSDNSLDYIVDQWTEVDLNRLGAAASIRLTFSGSDVGAFGLQTPAYVAFDHLRLTAVPEPSHGSFLVALAGLGLNRHRRAKPRGACYSRKTQE